MLRARQAVMARTAGGLSLLLAPTRAFANDAASNLALIKQARG